MFMWYELTYDKTNVNDSVSMLFHIRSEVNTDIVDSVVLV